MRCGVKRGKIGVEGRGVEPLTRPAPETASDTTRPPLHGREGSSLDSRPFPSTDYTRLACGGGRARIDTKPLSSRQTDTINLREWFSRTAVQLVPAGRFRFLAHQIDTPASIPAVIILSDDGLHSSAFGWTPSARARRSTRASFGCSPRSIADNSCWRMPANRATCAWVRSLSRRSLRRLRPTSSSTMPSCEAFGSS